MRSPLTKAWTRLNTWWNASAIPTDKELYQRQIDATDRQIDALVYGLCGLTDEEISIVESASG